MVIETVSIVKEHIYLWIVYDLKAMGKQPINKIP